MLQILIFVLSILFVFLMCYLFLPERYINQMTYSIAVWLLDGRETDAHASSIRTSNILADLLDKADSMLIQQANSIVAMQCQIDALKGERDRLLAAKKKAAKKKRGKV